jgi:hypothetical protein
MRTVLLAVLLAACGDNFQPSPAPDAGIMDASVDAYEQPFCVTACLSSLSHESYLRCYEECVRRDGGLP